MRILIVIILMLLTALAHGQTHTMPGSNVVPSGATLTISSGGTINAAGGSTITGFGSPLQWDGGSTNLVAATGRTSLALVPGTNVEVPLTFSTGLTRSTNTVTVNTSQNIATLSNLTTNGFVKTGGAVGTLSVDTATYQASNANLTSWAAITRASGIDTFATTPSSANLRSALTDENGTGAALFSGATTPDFTTGFTIGGAAASGKILIGNATNFVPSTPTYPNAASPTALKWIRSDGTNWIASTATASDSPGTAGHIYISDGTNWITSTPTWPTTAGTAGYTIRSDGTNIASYPQDMMNSSTASVTSSYNADTYLVGSSVVVAAGDFKLKGQYHCVFDMAKAGAGTGIVVITVRAGTAGTTGDTAIMTFTFGAGTGVADLGVFDVWVNIRTTGASATSTGTCLGRHNLATTGIFNNAAVFTVTGAANASFNQTTATTIGLSFTGGTTFTGTNTLVQATLIQ